MKKHYRFILSVMLVVFYFSNLFATLPEIKTLRTRYVGPGVQQKTLSAPTVPWMIYVLEVDLDNPHISVETVDGGRLVQPSVMAKGKDSTGHRLVGCTNGDFFESDASSTNSNIVNGEIVKLEELSSSYPVYWPSLAIDGNNKMTIGCHKYEGVISLKGSQFTVNDINTGRGSNELIFYNQYKGSSTGTNTYGTEIRVRPLEDWSVNGSVQCLVEIIETGIGNMQILPGTAVLSGNGTSASDLNAQFNVGDTLDVLLKMKTFEDLSSSGVSYNYLSELTEMKYLIGGFPTIVRNGQNFALSGYANENGGSTFATALHPRTAVGFNQDTSKMFLVVVDGRQTVSAGINLIDLADIMLKLGAWRAMNFDGGGSSVMFANNKIINSPSDGGERYVRNCVALYSTAPQGENTLVQIERDSANVYKNQSLAMTISVWDNYYNPISQPDWSQIRIYCDESVGSIEGSDGEYAFKASLNGASGYIYAVSPDTIVTDSMYIASIELDPIMISPKTAMTDTNTAINFIVHGMDGDQKTVKLKNAILEFSTSDTTIGYVDDLGSFHGISEGTTQVYVRYGDIYDSALVEVVVSSGEVSLNTMEVPGNWILTGENLDSSATGLYIIDRPDGVNGEKAFRIDYKTTGTGKIYLSQDIPIEGLAEILLFDALSDGENYRIYTQLEDIEGNIVSPFTTVSNTDAYETKFIDISAITTSYPLVFKSFYIPLKIGIQEGSIYLDDLRVTYPGNTAISYSNEDGNIPKSFKLYPCYPNPFNPHTTFAYDLSTDSQVSLEVFNLRGERIDMPVNSYQNAGRYQITWTPGNIGSGCYIYRVMANGQTAYGKLLFLK